jgi:hypothetical protein
MAWTAAFKILSAVPAFGSVIVGLHELTQVNSTTQAGGCPSSDHMSGIPADTALRATGPEPGGPARSLPRLYLKPERNFGGCTTPAAGPFWPFEPDQINVNLVGSRAQKVLREH